MLPDYFELLRKFNSKVGELQFSYLNVLNVGWEGGTARLSNSGGEALSVNISRAGGMAVIVGELPNALVAYGKESKIKIRINSVAPYIGGAMRENSLSSLVKLGYLRKVLELESVYNGKKYEVEVYEGDTNFGRQYLLKSNAWAGKFGGNMSPYILTLEGREENAKMEQGYKSNNPHSISLIEERAYVVFSQAAAKLYDYTKSNVALLHDYHSSLALFYNERINPVIIGHNMAYQGIMGVNLNNPLDLPDRLNLSEDVINKYFRAWATKTDIGCGNILQAVLRKSKEKTGISATTVSPGYVEELKETLDDLKYKIRISSDEPLPENYFNEDVTRKRIKDFYLNHFDIKITDEDANRFLLIEESRGLEELRIGNIIGILNGLDVEKHASKNKLLKDIVLNPYNYDWQNIQTPAYLGSVIAKDPYFKDGLNFDVLSPVRVFKCKKVLRKILLMEFFPDKKDSAIWDDDTSFIHYSWGRLVDQKNIPLIIAEAENITKNGNILIVIAANPDDRLSREVEDIAASKSEAMRKAGLRFAFSSRFDCKGAIFAGGADLVHIPSKYEPCGLTDMESYWMGTPVVAHMVGGLGKGGYAVGGFTADPTSLEAMCKAYREVYTRAVNIKKHFPDQWRELCLEALRLDFSYLRTANDYIDVMYIAITKHVINLAVEIAEACNQGLADQDIMDELLEIVTKLPIRLRKVYLEAWNMFPYAYGDKAFFHGVSEQTIKTLFEA